MEPNGLTPELQSISLPSTIGLTGLRAKNLTHLALQECRLREGQLNDALQGIRTGVGYKSLLYRTKIRKAPTYREKLRGFDEVHIADESIRKYVRIYAQARKAIERLFDYDDLTDVSEATALLERYRPIVKEDLRVETTVIEAFTPGPGLRDKVSAWFWHVEDAEAAKGAGWIQDCK